MGPRRRAPEGLGVRFDAVGDRQPQRAFEELMGKGCSLGKTDLVVTGWGMGPVGCGEWF